MDLMIYEGLASEDIILNKGKSGKKKDKDEEKQDSDKKEKKKPET